MSKISGKILSLILMAALLLSVFSVFSFAAAEGEEEESDSTLQVILNRTFDEGWEINNGINYQPKSQEIDIDSEQNADYSYNHFVRYTCTVASGADTDGCLEFHFGDNRYSGGGVIEYDMKCDELTSLLYVGYYLSSGSAAIRHYVPMYTIKENILYGNFGTGDFKMGTLTNRWLHVAMVYQFDQNNLLCRGCNTYYYKSESTPNCGNAECEGKVQSARLACRIYFGHKDVFDWRSAENINGQGNTADYANKTYYRDSLLTMNSDNIATLASFRLGFRAVEEKCLNQSFCVDNFLAYYDSDPRDEYGNPKPMEIIDDISDVEKYGYGTEVNENKAKTYPLKTYDGSGDAISAGMIMKTGSNYMLSKNVKRAIYVNSDTGAVYGAPRKIDGVVYLPFEAILESTGYPVLVHDDGISYDISTAAGSSTLTLGRDSAVVNGERVALKAAPVMIADPNNPENTYPVIAMDDVEKFFPGYYVSYDDMGFIAITTKENALTRENDLAYMLTLMKKFIFDDPTEEELYEKVKANTNDFDHPYLIADDEKFEFMNDIYEGRAEDETYKSWLDSAVKKADELYKFYTTLPKNPANETYKSYAYLKEDGLKYKHLAFEITNPFYGIKDGEVWTDSPLYDYCGPADEDGNYWGKRGDEYNDGYDWAGSRLDHNEAYSEQVLALALAYRITKDEKYANLAYDMVISLCDAQNWHNWGHKHFLNCAGMLGNLGLAYDWLYDIWSELQLERGSSYRLKHITYQMYRKAIYYGYDVTRYSKTSDVWTKDAYGATSTWNWSRSEINWNAVCASGLVIGSLAIVGESDNMNLEYYTDEDRTDRVKWCMKNNYWNLVNYGLSQYAPDGSYIEGPGYWAYATNNLAKMIWAITTAVGDDMGLYETWGLDKTFYFAAQVEYQVAPERGTNTSGYATWAYHDDGGGAQDTNLFLFASDMLGDNGLAAIRIHQLTADIPKEVSWYDILGYKAEYKELTLENANLVYDWKLEGCDGAIARSTWDGYGVVVGVMGGSNGFGNHAHMDSGAFTYVNDGFEWFPDLGMDWYNIYDYFGTGVRQFYYRLGTEGHNLVTITSQPAKIPYGQLLEGGGKLADFHSEEKGMYAVIDNAGAYGSIASYARRGMLLTNSRETVVIQDEIAFLGVESCVWLAHTRANIRLSDDKKTAFLTMVVDGKTEYLRVTLYSDNTRLKFETMTCGIGKDDFIFAGTHRWGWSEEMGGIEERGRDLYTRLVVRAENTLVFNCAVVIESVDSVETTAPVKYEYTKISNWAISDGGEFDKPADDGGKDNNLISSAKMTDIKTYATQAEKLIESGFAFTTRSADFFRHLARVTVAVNTYRPETFKNIEQIYNAYLSYLENLELYNGYKSDINDAAYVSRTVGSMLSMAWGI